MSGLSGRVSKSVAKRGVVGTVLFGMKLAWLLVSGALLAKYISRRRAHADDKAFDEIHGIETADPIDSNDLSTASQNKIFATSYQPIDASHFSEKVGALGIDFHDYVFVDLGSGKGRALLLASGHPFKRIVGIEFDEDLVKVARANIDRYPDAMKKCKDIEILCQDAAAYAFPDDPLLIYMYNPFEAPVMKRVAEAVRRSHERLKRRMLVVYFTPLHADVWDAEAFLTRIDGDGDPVVYVTEGSAKHPTRS